MTKIRRKRYISILTFGLIGIMVLAGCTLGSGSGTTPTVSNTGDVGADDNAGDEAYPPPGDDTEDDDQVGSDDGDVGGTDAYPAPGEVASQPEAAPADSDEEETLPTPAPEIPEPKTEMEASNPETVSLASGEIQLVEFFAFW